MKKLNLIIFFTALLFSYSNAQSTDQDSDYGRISLTPYVTNNINGIPNIAKNMLQRKLEKIVTKNGSVSSFFKTLPYFKKFVG